ncbi:dipeptide ABC transporter ATP-binding protein [Nocardioides acrostichi]|uniref:ABC transporter ATP-binding protein n=1 Tax=Nocardioides acrostichi TaxID=2784339 RepID=A0A930YBT2_9ACTN|nr:ABC transporter ATP-binding protein [Nocardioides acrostichi]MBF4160779.1 ABC transporter ATP-binding protein [Nocardioides acrostichi]
MPNLTKPFKPSAPVLAVDDLRVAIHGREIVHGVSFEVPDGGCLGVVGESGSGKSLTVLSATGLLDIPGASVSGSSRLGGAEGDVRDRVEIVGASRRTLRSVLGRRVGFVFQDPGTSLNPLLTLERQLTEGPEQHLGMTRRAARQHALDLLDAVGVPDPADRLHSYPHQLSGGQRQRVMIAVALACDPDLLIADEPTTALDVTTQAQVIDLVRSMQADRGMGVVWISHDLGVIGQVADEVTVLRQGEAVERNDTLGIFDAPQHDYTRLLLDARPVLGHPRRMPEPAPQPLVGVEDLHVTFTQRADSGTRRILAVQGVSFEVPRGTTLGIVGESGSGKSTIAGVLTRQTPADSGSVRLGDVDVLAAKGKEGRDLKRRIAMVFQDPFAALNPRATVSRSISEPLRVHHLLPKRDVDGRVRELLELVELPADFAERYPHQLSGGQRQRVCIARALACDPDVLILDESTASLDVSIQAKVIDLLLRLQAELELTYLFIAHDLAVVEQISHEVLVMHRGRAVEHRSSAELFADPREGYTRSLLAAIPPVRPRAALG